MIRLSEEHPAAVPPLVHHLFPRHLLLVLSCWTTLSGARLCGVAPASFVDAAEEGRLLSQVFLPQDYRGEAQVMDIAQTPDGLVYASNLGAIKEYDGHDWRSIPVPTSWIKKLAVAPDGRIYFSAFDEIGCLEPGPDGLRTFHSLLEHVPAGLKPLGQQWGCAVHDGGAYWSTTTHVLRWKDGTMRVWPWPADAIIVMRHGGRHLYVVCTGDAVYRLDGEAWTVISRDPRLVRGVPFILDDWAGPGPMVACSDGTFWRIDPSGAIEAVPNDFATAGNGGGLVNGLVLRDGRLAVTTRSGGLFVLRRDGTIDQRFGLDGGVGAACMFKLCQDREGGLWVGTSYGVVRVDLNRAVTLFDERNGAAPGVGLNLARHEGRLFACGENGLYRFEPGEAGRCGHFERVEGEAFVAYELLDHPSGLLAVGDYGLFRYADGKVVHECETSDGFYTVAPSVTDPNRIFVGSTEMVRTLRWDGARWQDEGAIEGLHENAASLVEDATGSLWIGTPVHGAVRVRRQEGHADWQSARAEIYDTARGLPEGHDWVTASASAMGPLFAHARGVSVFDPQTDRLVPCPAFVAAGCGERYVYPIAAGRGPSVWLQLGYPARGDTVELGGLLPTAGGGWRWASLPASAHRALDFLGASDFMWEHSAGDEGVLWVVSQSRLVRVDLTHALEDTVPAHHDVLLRGVSRGSAALPTVPEPALALDSSHDALRLRFASPVFGTRAPIEYQYRMLGDDERWSAWSTETEATFTNLPAGRLTFEVRSRLEGGEPGPVTSWSAVVRPPWWRSGGATAIAALLALGVIAAIVRWRTGALRREQRRLEAIVRERTEQLGQERDRAEAANRAKTMFLANMSHELRTPLHAILGYSQLLGSDPSLTAMTRDRLNTVAASGRHLLRLINEVLDLSKIEAGRLELQVLPFDLPSLLDEIATAQQARAAARSLVFRRPDTTGLPVAVMGDAPKLRQVLENLLGNAIKFTPAGEVRLLAMPGADGRVRFEVSDTGIGIAPGDIGRLFRPFTQIAPGSVAGAEGGTGLGLAIAQRLVGLMGGMLAVDSKLSQGTRFWFEITLAHAPVAGVAQPAAGTKSRRITGYEGPRRRVLAVDDVEANRQLFVDLLAPLGFEVMSTASAGETLALLDRFRPDLVLLDLRLPEVDGFALARMLRADRRLEGVKILAASASVFGHDPDAARAAGCDDFISKPFLPDEFFARIAELLGLTWCEADEHGNERDEPLARELLEPLRKAARTGDVVAMREALAHLRTRHPLARAVEGFAHAIESFDTDGLCDLVDQALARSGLPDAHA